MSMFKIKKTSRLFVGLLAMLLSQGVSAQDFKIEEGIWSGGEHFQLDGKVVPVEEDGIHDPTNAAVKVLQQPVDAMLEFPRDAAGIIDWVKALDEGLVNPRASKEGGEEMHVVDFDVIFKNTASMPYVRYPHRQHTEWLTCNNCHPKIFLPQKGGNPTNMSDIMQGKFCGVCHGKVAFPPTKNCGRCHSVSRDAPGIR